MIKMMIKTQKSEYQEIEDLDDTTFNQITGEMEKLTGNAYKLARNNYDNFEKFQKDLQNGVKGQIDNVGMILDGYTVTLENFWNKVMNMATKGGEASITEGSILASALFGVGGDFDTELKTISKAKSEILNLYTELDTAQQKGIITTEDYIKRRLELVKTEESQRLRLVEIGNQELIRVNSELDKEIVKRDTLKKQIKTSLK
jgi:hypothetical protein